MKLAGIDGCKKGWLIVSYIDGGYDLEIFESFQSLMEKYHFLDRILIDIPIGLSAPGYPRTIDAKIRRELKNRSSTVFNAPCRLGVYEKDDEKARAFNKQVENKSLSLQSLFIREKIRQVDQYLNGLDQPIEITESHPELCFKYLNGRIVQSKKSKQEGIRERMDIIGKWAPELAAFYHQQAAIIKSKDAKKDDIIDAICLCLVNQLGAENRLSYLTDENAVDEKGIEMRIAYYLHNL